jgi:hypothetical protein
VTDVTVGEQNYLRGHWLDRLPAIDKDIAALEAMLAAMPPSSAKGEISLRVAGAIRSALERKPQAAVAMRHSAPERFARGEAIAIAAPGTDKTVAVRLHYRHVDQAENYVLVAMEKDGSRYTASIPAEYTKTEFPIQYYFEVHTNDGEAGLYPGFNQQLTNQPYFVVRAV